MIRSFRLALGLLTRLPVPTAPTEPTPAESGWSVMSYPLVGALIGILLMGMDWILSLGFGEGVGAALLLVTWVGLTGGLHLDGLADWADAWIGGLGNPERTQAILKDPRSGPAAIVALTLLLLLKWIALVEMLAGRQGSEWLIMAPVLGRCAMAGMMATTPYLNPHGMGALAARHLPATLLAPWLALCGLLVIAGHGAIGGVAVVATILVAAWLRRGFQQRLGGINGDALGATCELVEVAVLLVLAWS